MNRVSTPPVSTPPASLPTVRRAFFAQAAAPARDPVPAPVPPVQAASAPERERDRWLRPGSLLDIKV